MPTSPPSSSAASLAPRRSQHVRAIYHPLQLASAPCAHAQAVLPALSHPGRAAPEDVLGRLHRLFRRIPTKSALHGRTLARMYAPLLPVDIHTLRDSGNAGFAPNGRVHVAVRPIFCVSAHNFAHSLRCMRTHAVKLLLRLRQHLSGLGMPLLRSSGEVEIRIQTAISWVFAHPSDTRLHPRPCPPSPDSHLPTTTTILHTERVRTVPQRRAAAAVIASPSTCPPPRNRP
ncbi:hypothetical protein OH76DRAFT_1134027 [Lentinus brumalis]|uniref:Uncharacterized protein n=1 Tax=Lentinus brumalis TaxID=2498619 RepID=A0A371CUL6_9APHY|nr:hypothetical protein OH76DRAFT_1134027 [Polyporus brumalis]